MNNDTPGAHPDDGPNGETQNTTSSPKMITVLSNTAPAIPKNTESTFKRQVQCLRYKTLLPGLETAPMLGELGEKIFNEISEDAWSDWVKHSTMIINEYRLNPATPAGYDKLLEHMTEFLFEGKNQILPEFTPTAEDLGKTDPESKGPENG